MGMTKEDNDKQILLDSLAEESPMVLSTAYVYAKNYVNYGEDITKVWTTAVQQAYILEKVRHKAWTEAYDSFKREYEARLKADYVSKKKIAQATNKIIKCSLGEWYAGRVDGKTEEVVLMDDVLHIMQGLLNEKEQINEN